MKVLSPFKPELLARNVTYPPAALYAANAGCCANPATARDAKTANDLFFITISPFCTFLMMRNGHIISYHPTDRKAKMYGFKQKKHQISDKSITPLKHEIRHACNDAGGLSRRALKGTVCGGWMNEGMSPCNAET